MEIQWTLLIFSLFVGLGMGSFAIVSISELRGNMPGIRLPGAITSLAALGVGSIASYFHLGHPEKIFHVLGNIRSGIAQELVVTSIAGAVIFLYTVLLWKDTAPDVRRKLAWAGLILSPVVPFATGRIYVLAARPAWDTWLLPLMYMVSAAVLGAFTMYLWMILREPDHKMLATVNKAALWGQLSLIIIIAAYLIYLAVAPHPHASRSVTRLLTGDLAVLFWGAVVLVGLLVPLFLTWRNMQGHTALLNIGAPATLTSEGGGTVAAAENRTLLAGAGLLCVFVGSAAIRIIVYLIGSSVQSYIY
ncbi:MAG: DmsC/YnfH family molybdoenzyme membrane anchor subunit [Sporomusaceae bacterium]|nr:DmsC/YnfH family molybdoenzyme membrane anchor subunit [Sporomusaceae bacterium]